MPLEAWRAIDRSRAAPTFQARPAWAQAFADAYDHYTAAPIECVLSDGSHCFVPLVRSCGRLPWRVFVGTPLGGYTAVLDGGGRLASPEATEAVIRHLLARAGHSVMLTPWPFGHRIDDMPASEIAQETSVIDLADGVEAALSRMDGTCRRMAGQAERRGVRCTRADAPNAIDVYYSMLEESAIRWGRKTPTFPKRFLEALVARGSGDVEIWFAAFEREAIAGGVMIYGRDEAYFWSAAMRAEYGTLRPSNALNVALIRAAADRGVRWYDLGSSDGLAGVQRFKEGLGAVAVSYRTWKRETPLYRLFRALRGRKAASIGPLQPAVD
jgi:CelD/BcsL family acetyltransferase involved in cellulose biosynthesis